MAKFVFTVEDGENGSVLITSDPSLHGREVGDESLAKCLSAAEVYALIAWCALTEAGKTDAELCGRHVSRGDS